MLHLRATGVCSLGRFLINNIWTLKLYIKGNHLVTVTEMKCEFSWAILILTLLWCGSGSSVDIASYYGLDGPGIEFRWGRDFPPVQTGPEAHPASCTMGTGSLPGVKCARGVLLTTHPLLASSSWKSRAIPVPPLGHNRACNGVTLPFYIAFVWGLVFTPLTHTKYQRTNIGIFVVFRFHIQIWNGCVNLWRHDNVVSTPF
jgi:hypothetical protein